MAEVDVIRSREALSRIGAECDRLAARTGFPMLRHDWLQACAVAFADRSELAIYVARDGSRVRAIAPLVEELTPYTRRLCALGHQIGEPEAFGFDDEEALTALSEAICCAGLPLVMKRLPEDSAELRTLQRVASGHGFVVRRAQSTQSAWAPLAQWDQFVGRLSGNSRRLLGRRLRQAAQAGEVRLDVQVPDEQAVDAQLDRFIRVEAAGWKGEAGSAIAKDPVMETFYRAYARAAAGAGILRLLFLTIGGETVAGRLAVAIADRLWEIKIGYDEAWSRVAPGILLTHQTLQYACEEGLEALEYLGAAEGWQERWPRSVRQHDTVRFYPYTLRGGLALTGDSIGYLARASTRERVRAE